MQRPTNASSAAQIATQRLVAAAQQHLRGEETALLYLAAAHHSNASAVLRTVTAELRAASHGERLMACTGQDFVQLWHDTLRRGMTPFIRRALTAKCAILITGMEALREEPFAQAELARLVTPRRLVILAGHCHLRHLTAWSPTLAKPLAGATSLCLHDGPCVSAADAWEIVDLVAGYYGLTRRLLLSPCRTAPVALARQVAMVLMREQGLSYSAVGRLLRRDHATVLYGCRRIRQISACERFMRHDLAALCRDTRGRAVRQSPIQ